MDLLIYLFFVTLAMVLFFLAIYERGWIYSIFAFPFLVLLIPASFSITHLHAETLLVENTDTEVTVYPFDVWVSTGTLNSGNITSLQASDGALYDVQEVTGAPGFDILFTFSQCDILANKLSINMTYTGSHSPQVDLYDGEDEAWDMLINLSASTSGRFNGSIINSLDYYGDGCLVLGRLYHSEIGNAAHKVEIDEVHLEARLSQTTAETYYEEVPYGGGLWVLAMLWFVFAILDVALFYVLFTLEKFEEIKEALQKYSRSGLG